MKPNAASTTVEGSGTASTLIVKSFLAMNATELGSLMASNWSSITTFALVTPSSNGISAKFKAARKSIVRPFDQGSTTPGSLIKSNDNESEALTLKGPGSSTVDGVVRLLDPVSILAFTTRDHTVTGSGEIDGQSNSAHIRIASGKTLTSNVDITGRLTVSGAGTFINDGAVIANDPNGTIEMATTTIDDTAGAGRWQVTLSSTARLLFSVEPAALAGDFTVSNGTLRAGIDPAAPGDDIDVDTTGCLTHTGGKIFAGVNDSFSFCPAVR